MQTGALDYQQVKRVESDIRTTNRNNAREAKRQLMALYDQTMAEAAHDHKVESSEDKQKKQFHATAEKANKAKTKTRNDLKQPYAAMMSTANVEAGKKASMKKQQ